MEIFLPKFHRRSIRLKGYDYSKEGYYFVTICTEDKKNLFGKIQNDKMILNDVGKMILQVWKELPGQYCQMVADEFVVMPNHVHGIIKINTQPSTVGAGPRACPRGLTEDHIAQKLTPEKRGGGQPRGVAPTGSLSNIVHGFKSFTTAKYRHEVRSYGWKPFVKRLWQRNYYEHIIRHPYDLFFTREYIKNNPQNWLNDKNNPTLSSKLPLAK